MTEASATTDPTKLAPPKKPWNRRIIKALKATGVLLTLTCLGTCYWWFFTGIGQLTDENLQKLKPGLSRSEVHAILRRPDSTADWRAGVYESMEERRARMSESKRSLFFSAPERNAHDSWQNRRRSVTVEYSGRRDDRKLKTFDFYDPKPTFRGLWNEVTDEHFWKNLNPFD